MDGFGRETPLGQLELYGFLLPDGIHTRIQAGRYRVAEHLQFTNEEYHAISSSKFGSSERHEVTCQNT
jgi:hypothetical protein